jgi:hypothetical protein
MSSRLENFSDDDALLVMYLANELSPADKVRVEDRLVTDSALRAALADLRAAQTVYDDVFRRLDAAMPLPLSAEAAAQRTSRLMRHWVSGRIIRPQVAPKRRQLSFPWWSYPLATAAAVAILVTVWGVERVGRQKIGADSPVSVARAIDDLSPDQQDGLLMYASGSGAEGDDADAAALDKTDDAIAAVQSSDDVDSLLLNIGGDTDNGKALP